MSYEIAFTKAFADNVQRTPAHLLKILNREFEFLATDPYAKHPNAKAIKNRRHTFSLRIGIHVRLIYEVQQTRRRVVLCTIRARGIVYYLIKRVSRKASDSRSRFESEVAEQPFSNRGGTHRWAVVNLGKSTKTLLGSACTAEELLPRA